MHLRKNNDNDGKYLTGVVFDGGRRPEIPPKCPWLYRLSLLRFRQAYVVVIPGGRALLGRHQLLPGERQLRARVNFAESII